jgi:polygalacturonase
MERSWNVEIEEMRWVNSPYYHLYITDIDSFYIHDIEIFVDIFKQEELLSAHGLFDHSLGIPTFPLNTDGIDPAGSNITIRNVKITSFDDSIAVKACHRGYFVSECSENIYVENVLTYFGIGMTIGSVPPSTNNNCVRNVHFKNVTQHVPIKAIYVKSNPGNEGTGIIENIMFEDFKINFPIWWGIYIGP